MCIRDSHHGDDGEKQHQRLIQHRPVAAADAAVNNLANDNTEREDCTGRDDQREQGKPKPTEIRTEKTGQMTQIAEIT